MAGFQVGGPTKPVQYGGPGTPSGYSKPTQPSGYGSLTKYRQDAGSDMTDAQYAQWQNSRSGGLAGAAAQQGIQTDAQKALAAQQAELQKQQMGYGAGLQGQAESRRMQMFSPYLKKMMDSFNKTTTVGPGAGEGGPKPATVDFGNISAAEDAARQASFARAKDQAGLIARSAMTGLNNAMGARGLAGSRYASGNMAGVVNQGANQLGEINREQAIQDLDVARKRASELYQGGISQRGQDVTMRGQDIAARQQYQQILAGLMGQFPGQITARY